MAILAAMSASLLVSVRPCKCCTADTLSLTLNIALLGLTTGLPVCLDRLTLLGQPRLYSLSCTLRASCQRIAAALFGTITGSSLSSPSPSITLVMMGSSESSGVSSTSITSLALPAAPVTVSVAPVSVTAVSTVVSGIVSGVVSEILRVMVVREVEGGKELRTCTLSGVADRVLVDTLRDVVDTLRDVAERVTLCPVLRDTLCGVDVLLEEELSPSVATGLGILEDLLLEEPATSPDTAWIEEGWVEEAEVCLLRCLLLSLSVGSSASSSDTTIKALFKSSSSDILN